MNRKIAFVGLGAMGGPMASNAIRALGPLHVFDVVEGNLARVVAAGGIRCASIEEAARNADIVVTMLPATPQVHEVVAAALEVMKPGGIVLDMSTISPAGTDAAAAMCDARGIHFIDAPVGRLASHAAAGKSLFMVGCDDEQVFAEVKPLFDAMGDTIIRCGGRGTGIRIKIVNNFQVLTIAQITAEALVLAAKLGVDIETVKAINAGTTATNGQMQVNFATKSLVGDTEPGFTIDLAHKDLTLAMEAAGASRLGLPAGAAIHAVYGAARSGPYARKDFSALLDYAADLAAISPPRLQAK